MSTTGNPSPSEAKALYDALLKLDKGPPHPVPALPDRSAAVSSSTRPPPADPSAVAIGGLVMMGVIAVPLALITLIPMRRGFRQLGEQMSTLKAIHAEALRQSSMTHGKALKVLDETRSGLLKHREESGTKLAALLRDIGTLHKASEEWKVGEERMNKELGAIKAEVKALSAKGSSAVSLSSQTLEEMASSLVDVAAFIEEVETLEGLERRGTDPRGVDKIRKLALKLHSMAGTPVSSTAATVSKAEADSGRQVSK